MDLVDGEQPEAPGRAEAEPRRQPSVRDRRRVRIDEGEPESAPEEGSGSSLESVKKEAETYLDDLRRLKAEFENYRKRVLKEQTDLIERASEALVGRLLPVLDNFELAVAAAEASRDFDRMLRGVELVFGELKEVLSSQGLRTIDARGKKFDPSLHEAAVEVPGDEAGDLVVTEVLRPGYMIKGRVIRPAMVKVRRQT